MIKPIKNKMSSQHKIDPSLSRDYQDAFKRGFNKKFHHQPMMSSEEPKKVSLADRIRKNLQSGLASKYSEKS